MIDGKIGPVIRARRIKKRITLTKLAEDLGISVGQLCDWEHGRKEPRGSQLLKAFDILGLKRKDFGISEPTTEVLQNHP